MNHNNKINLITVAGESAQNFYLKAQHISDFKSLMRTVTSGRVMIVSTKFRSDLFYSADQSKNDSILKLWALYTSSSQASFGGKDFITRNGDETSLSSYFHSINSLATNWHQYMVYKKAFQYAFSNDQENPMAKTVVQCDQYLIEHTSANRTPLTSYTEKMNSKLTKDTLSIAMHIIKNETRSN